MEISNIVYYTRQNEKRRTLSLRDLCLKEKYDCGLQTIFYAVRDSVDAQGLLTKLQEMCHEQIELERDNSFYIRFTVHDVYDNINYLKFNKPNNKVTSVPHELRMGA